MGAALAAAWSLGCAVAVAGLWVLGGVLAGLDYAGVWSPAPAGPAERASITVGMLWPVSPALSVGERVQSPVASR
ncbi:hypothetical protein [Pseudonocardia lacus]|uniref:hypothetical protein n=1 Tax=Pseudonocardia lacus TaxID=2835865 RepID=UPI001BDC19BC|nr:hypothetical protein [Pseudonocardia lacus]